MKNRKKKVLLLPIVTMLLTLCNGYEVQAKESYSEYYPMGCNAYEVDTVNDSGNFDQKGCFSSFAEASNAMKQSGDDAVVRHAASYSPSKIIAMNSGIAYSYPQREGGITLDVKQYGTDSVYAKTTYIEKHREIFYTSTDSYDGNGNGTIHGTVSGFDSVISLKNVDLVPFKFVKNNLSIYLGGNSINGEDPVPFLTKVRTTTYTVEKNGNYKELHFTAYKGWAVNGKVPGYAADLIIGPAASWMNVGTTYYSKNDYDFYSDMECRNYVGTYYNYYQFMPLRQKSNIPASAYNTFLQANQVNGSSKLWNTGEMFVEAQKNYGINALLLFTQAVHESGWGTSALAMNKNNLFGWGAFDSNPNNAASFASVAEGINIHAGKSLREYINTSDRRFFGSHFGNKESGISVKYASDAYYGLKIASLAYQFDKIYNDYDGNLTEYNSYPIGVIKNYGDAIYDSINGNVMYTTEYGATYQRNFTVTVLAEKDGWYKVQSTDYLENGKQLNTAKSDFIDYNWDTNVGWIEKSHVDLIAGLDVESEPTEIIGSAVVNVNGLRVRQGPGLGYAMVGYAKENGAYNVYDIKQADGYTWYQIGKGQWFASKDNWVSYYPKQEEKPVEPEKPVTPETPPTPETPKQDVPSKLENCEVIDTPQENRSLLAGINSVNYDETNHTVTLDGLALFQGIDAIAGKVKHDLLLSDPVSKKSIIIPCTTSNNNEDLFGDGHTYQAINFKVTLDLNDFENCNYNLGIRVRNGDQTGYYSFFMSSSKDNHSYKKEDGTLVKVFADPIANYRYSISAEKQSIDMSTVNKPSNVTSMFGTTDLSLNDGHFKMNAFSGIYLSDFTKNTNPTYEVLLEDENGNVTTFDTTKSNEQMDITDFMDRKHSYTDCCFDLDADLSKLQSGTYRIYIHVKTNQVEDIFEMYSLQSQKDITASYEGRTYTLSKTNVRSRYILTIQ